MLNIQWWDDRITSGFCGVPLSWHVRSSGAECQQCVSIFPKACLDMSCDELLQCVLLPWWVGRLKENKRLHLKVQLKERRLEALIQPNCTRATDNLIIITVSFSNGDRWISQYSRGTQINFFYSPVIFMQCGIGLFPITSQPRASQFYCNAWRRFNDAPNNASVESRYRLGALLKAPDLTDSLKKGGSEKSPGLLSE